ncbi:MAG: hypothetical protein RXO54_08110 [Acidilobus sp.]|jgi:hypothetical protein
MSESVHEMSPKEIVDRLMTSVTDGWARDLLNSDLSTWDFAEGTIYELENPSDEFLNSKSLADFLAEFAYDAADDLSMSKEEFVQLWSKLTPEQKRAFLKDLIHDVALDGLEEFLDYVGGDLDINAVKDYLNGKISFRDLMDRLAKKYDVDEYEPYDEVAGGFWHGVSLADYVSDEELKELVRKYVLPKLEKRK